MCGEDVSVPAAPAAAAPSAAETSLETTEAQDYALDLATRQEQATQSQAAQDAFAAAMGEPYSTYLANTAVDEATLNKDYMTRYEAGLSGTLPVDPSMEASLEEQKANLDEQYQKQLGPGYATSTPYQNALKQYNTEATSLRTAAQTGALTEGEQAGYASPTSTSSASTSLTTPTQIGSPSQTSDLYQYYLAQQGMQNQNNMAGYNAQVNAALAGAGSTGSMISGGAGLLGNIFGAAGAAKGFGNLFGG